MADNKPAVKAAEPISVQNKDVQDKANARMIQEAIEAESMEQEMTKKANPLDAVTLVKKMADAAPGGGGIGNAPAAAVLQPKLVSRSGSSMPMLRAEEANTSWDVAFGNCPTPDVALNSPELLWKVSPRLKRGDSILLHDEFWGWEVMVRVIKVDKELQCVFVDAISAPVTHKITTAGIDFSKMEIVNRGPVGRWSVIMEKDTPRSRVVQEHFETEAQAQQWLLKKKAA